MGKLDYLDALKRAMTGLAPAVQAKTLAYYEQRFVDGINAGRSEAAVAAELDEPKKIAMTLRASAHMAAFDQQRSPASVVRMLVSGLGLTIFNLLMVVPAAVYLTLLTALYTVALAIYIIGIAVTASSLTGANELVLNRPFGIVLSNDGDGSERLAQTHVIISERGITVKNDRREAAPEAAADADTDADAEADADADADADSVRPRPSQVMQRAEDVTARPLRITTDVGSGSRATQTAFGLLMVVGAIVLFLVSLVVSKYTLLGLRRYLQMNLSLLKGS
ncbi:DUF1700 domain-containing protein [Massilia sp. PWRC2]|uniref:DUF1700 domain-containing protein n=1 Tax=Massilia sp. PWRC2 TaxID=2804626 RepID=UPI003CF1328F